MKEKKMKNKKALDEIVRCIGVLTFGEERWYRSYSFDDIWHDKWTGNFLTTKEMVKSVCEALKEIMEF